MFYRRKVILALLQALGGELGSEDFQAHLFLFTRTLSEPAYDFVPYKSGPYSFSAEADREPMIKKGLLNGGDGWSALPGKDYRGELAAEDQQSLQAHVSQYGSLRGKALMEVIAKEHPYYVINLENLDEVVSGEDLERVRRAKPHRKEAELSTIGYEGKSLESYLNELFDADVKVLCDVRQNPISRKYGFSRRQLQDAVEKVGIRYVPMPELGIDASKRTDLDSPEDYQRLFEEYEREMLPQRGEYLKKIVDLLEEQRRVALTCYEADPTMCHRYRITNALAARPNWRYPIRHI